MTGLDLTESIAPRSDQQNADDFVAGPKTVTITEVRRGTVEQPFEFHLKEFPGRPYKPSKSMRRVMVAAWGADASTYVGKRLTLYTDPDVKFGGATVGGIKISEMSDLPKPLHLALTATRGKRATHVVKPLAAEPTRPTVKPGPTLDVLLENAQEARTNDELNQIARAAAASLTGADLDAVKAIVTARREELKAKTTEPTPPEVTTGNVADWPTPATIPGSEA